MSHVLTLIAEALSTDHVARAAQAVGARAAPNWLSRDRAAELAFDGDGLAVGAAEAAARQALAGEPIDLLAQAAAGRRKRLLVADMDSTIITVECIDEMADLLGLRAPIAAITERAMAGEIDFPAALRERAGMLAGLEEAKLERLFRERIHLSPGARALVRTMRAHGAVTALVSGGFSFFTTRVAELAGFHLERANRLEIADGRLTGRVAEPILGADAKLAALRELLALHGLEADDALAVGDGANDLAMLRAAGLGVAYHAKPIVAQGARARVEHTDLRALLYFQGYADAEITEE